MNPRARNIALAIGLFAALGGWACSDASRVAGPEAPRDDLSPTFHRNSTDVWAVGGGRVDYPPGDPEKNTRYCGEEGGEDNPACKHFQIFAFLFTDRPHKDDEHDFRGGLIVVDFREEIRDQYCGGKLCMFYSTEINSVERIDPATLETECDPGTEGAVRARGKVREHRTGASYDFEVETCDSGEDDWNKHDRRDKRRKRPQPPSDGREPMDRFEFYLPEITDFEGDLNFEYCLHQALANCAMFPDPSDPNENPDRFDNARGAVLTGGNVQSRFPGQHGHD